MEKNRISSPPQQTAPAAPTLRSKPTTQAASDDASSGGAGGFLSLLSALGDSMECLVEDAAGTTVFDAAELLPADDAQEDGVDAAGLMAWLTSQTAQTGAGQLASDTTDLGQGASALTGLQDKSLASLQADLLPPGGLVAQTARLDGAADVRAQDIGRAEVGQGGGGHGPMMTQRPRARHPGCSGPAGFRVRPPDARRARRPAPPAGPRPRAPAPGRRAGRARSRPGRAGRRRGPGPG